MMKKLNFFLLAFVFLLAQSCGDNTSSESTSNENETEEDPTGISDLDNPSLSFEKNGIKVYALEGSPEFEAQITTANLETGAQLDAGNYTFEYNVSNYKLGAQTTDAADKGIANSGKGQHIHVILNNQPYMAHYNSSFEHELSEGSYMMVAFLSRSYHESVKSPGASLLTKFVVGAEEGEGPDLSAAHLVYSRPKGTYKGADTKKILLDFFLFNTDLSVSGNKVRATINGEEFMLPSWKPYLVEGLPMGENTFKLELLDGEGNLIEGPFNSVERTVTLQEATE